MMRIPGPHPQPLSRGAGEGSPSLVGRGEGGKSKNAPRRDDRPVVPGTLRAPAPVVEARALTRRYGRFVALRSVSFAAFAGERIGVIGPNGAGKSTLLRVLARQLRPTAGTLYLFGQPAGHARGTVRASLGYLGHQPWLYEELTSEENLRFFGRLYGLRDPHGAAAAALARVGISAQASKPVGQLSRGQQQRLALARATLHHPRLLLLDEPDASLDAVALARLEKLLGVGPAGDTGADTWMPTVFLATHDLELARSFCHRLLVLVDGRCVLDIPAGAISVSDLRAAYAGEMVAASPPGPRSIPDGAGESAAGGRGEAHPSWLTQFTAIITKDLRIEGRRRDNVAAAAVYAIVSLVIFNFALDAPGANPLRLVPGVVWVTLTYAAMIGFGRTFAQEHERGCLDALLLAPLDRSVLYLAKLLGNLALTVVLVLLTVPLVLVFFDVSFHPLGMALVLILGTTGLAAVGTLLSAIAAHTRAREVLLPVLLFPVAVPALLAAVHATTAALEGRMAWGGTGDAPWLHLLIAFDLLYVVLSCLVFEFALEE